MRKHITNPLRTEQETEKSDGLETLGGWSKPRRLQGCVARISRHGRRNSITVYTAGKEDAASAFSAIAGFLLKITSASQLKVEQRWQLIIYRAFRKYKLIYRLYPPLLGDQIMLPLA